MEIQMRKPTVDRLLQHCISQSLNHLWKVHVHYRIRLAARDGGRWVLTRLDLHQRFVRKVDVQLVSSYSDKFR
uniref:Uncharacterized protein n=1 Tax=Salix viminalis TaxID=40686 RepID=A0A6N2L1X6_SALVM